MLPRKNAHNSSCLLPLPSDCEAKPEAVSPRKLNSQKMVLKITEPSATELM